MLLTPYASSSRGNLYEVSDGRTRLLVECGLPLKKIHRLLDRPVTDYAACLVTHEHKDHSKAVGELLSRGVPCYMTQGTKDALGDEAAFATVVRYGKKVEIGSFSVKAFATAHDCAEPCGWLIHSTTTVERLVFATDTAFIRYRFPGLTEAAVECNYSESQLVQSELPPQVIDRIRATHMSFEQAGRWLVSNDLIGVRKVWLLHLSDRHSQAWSFEQLIAKTTGIETEACKEVLK
ncbi:MAG: hypothetical protein LBD02_01315 [Christensenellaceae bacterium]|jgi:phosphoribosyl 1,2-cyclic phosphodiesterase|nr:hypothetical protein [Christensenellaceae bacterium]